ncbi:hypothetical protein GALL_341410 [mine drainage metagenome]|uniref:Terminase large subunit gp17-like C-terminal domain-containing protein n=1 Tax=mine drainage metagenome TaxID=410659 RepID=A0A1J5R7D1_9ZZZZ
MNRWILGVDFGQRSDRTALAGVEVVPCEDVDVDADGLVTTARKPYLDVRYLHRLPLNMAYPDQCAFIANLVEGTPELARAEVVVDATGVGVAVADSLREVMRRGFKELSITGGAQATQDGNRISVPKRDLVSRLAVAMQSRRLRVSPGLPEAAALFDELGNFGVNISDTGSDSYGARTGHDDLVLATSYAVYLADQPDHGLAWLAYLRRQGVPVSTNARDWRDRVPGRPL